jgi:hypothetical protein
LPAGRAEARGLPGIPADRALRGPLGSRGRVPREGGARSYGQLWCASVVSGCSTRFFRTASRPT